jgi:hypothetical protein
MSTAIVKKEYILCNYNNDTRKYTKVLTLVYKYVWPTVAIFRDGKEKG